jgi:UDP-glucose:(heptosyl)LPS alpha-1,3-glucosyltransferase
LKVIQVVKRFGIYGGMEEYAYRLSHELKKIGIDVSVVCERIVNDPFNADFPIFELGETRKKPRWWSHLQFARRVREWVTDNDKSNAMIHSHERIDCHNITTIHSTLFNFPRAFALPSLRSLMNQRIERKEVLSQTVRAIVPVSRLISAQIKEKYPHSRDFLKSPIQPGVASMNLERKMFNPSIPVIGFMGREWKRKGLPKVIEIWRELRKETPLIKLCLAGFDKVEKIGLEHHEKAHVEILGYVKNKESFYQKIDLLLHPAKLEAFGMIVPEALSLGIPVLSSKETGASSINPELQNVISCSEPVNTWAKHTRDTLNKLSDGIRPRYSPQNWAEVANSYVKIYEELNR